jgi:hypothetical protein
VILTDEEYAQCKRQAGLIPLSSWFRSLTGIPRGEELATGEASARGTDASVGVRSQRLPKPAKAQKSIPAELPTKAPVDMKRFLP